MLGERAREVVVAIEAHAPGMHPNAPKRNTIVAIVYVLLGLVGVGVAERLLQLLVATTVATTGHAHGRPDAGGRPPTQPSECWRGRLAARLRRVGRR